MKEPYKKGVAIHLGPESCAFGREAGGEALTGGHAGQPSSSEITTPACRPGPDKGKATPGTTPSEPFPDAAESETLSMRGSSMRENRETSGTPVPWGAGRSGKTKVSDTMKGGIGKTGRCRYKLRPGPYACFPGKEPDHDSDPQTAF